MNLPLNRAALTCKKKLGWLHIIGMLVATAGRGYQPGYLCIHPKIARVAVFFRTIFIIGCGWDGKLLSSHAGLSFIAPLPKGHPKFFGRLFQLRAGNGKVQPKPAFTGGAIG